MLKRKQVADFKNVVNIGGNAHSSFSRVTKTGAVQAVGSALSGTKYPKTVDRGLAAASYLLVDVEDPKSPRFLPLIGSPPILSQPIHGNPGNSFRISNQVPINAAVRISLLSEQTGFEVRSVVCEDRGAGNDSLTYFAGNVHYTLPDDLPKGRYEIALDCATCENRPLAFEKTADSLVSEVTHPLVFGGFGDRFSKVNGEYAISASYPGRIKGYINQQYGGLRFTERVELSSVQHGKAGIFAHYFGSGRKTKRFGVGLFVDEEGEVTLAKFDHFGWATSEEPIGTITFPAELVADYDGEILRLRIPQFNIEVVESHVNSGTLHPGVGGYTVDRADTNELEFSVDRWQHKVPH